MREAIKKEKPNKVSCDADELDIYSLQDSLAVFFQYPPHYPLIDIYSQSQQEEPLIVPAASLLVAMASMPLQFVFSSAFNCAFGCGLPVCSRQDGKWIKEEKMSESLRDTSEPGAWCFVLSSFWQCFGSDWCHCLQLSDVFLLPPLSIQVRLLWFHDIINVSVSLTAFWATCSGLAVITVVILTNFGSHEGLFVALSTEAVEIHREHECRV